MFRKTIEQIKPRDQLQEKPTESNGSDKTNSYGFTRLSSRRLDERLPDAERCSVSGGRQSGKQEKHFSATRYEHIVGPQLVFPHIQRPHAAGQQLSAFSPGLTHTHLLLIHTHMPLSAMISGRLDSLSLPAKCPQPRLKAGSTHTGKKKNATEVFISKPDPISGNHRSILQRCR